MHLEKDTSLTEPVELRVAIEKTRANELVEDTQDERRHAVKRTL